MSDYHRWVVQISKKYRCNTLTFRRYLGNHQTDRHQTNANFRVRNEQACWKRCLRNLFKRIHSPPTAARSGSDFYSNTLAACSHCPHAPPARITPKQIAFSSRSTSLKHVIAHLQSQMCTLRLYSRTIMRILHMIFGKVHLLVVLL